MPGREGVIQNICSSRCQLIREPFGMIPSPKHTKARVLTLRRDIISYQEDSEDTSGAFDSLHFCSTIEVIE